MNKINVAVGLAAALATSAVLGVAVAIFAVHGPANAPTPNGTPAAYVQPLDLGDTTVDTTTSTDAGTTPPAPPATSTDSAPPAVSTVDSPPPTTTIDPTTTSRGDGINAPAPMPPTPTTTTASTPYCVPDGTGATVCN